MFFFSVSVRLFISVSHRKDDSFVTVNDFALAVFRCGGGGTFTAVKN